MEALGNVVEYMDEGGWRAVAILLMIACIWLAREYKTAQNRLIDCSQSSKEEIIELLEKCITAIDQGVEMDKAVKTSLDIYRRLETISGYVQYTRGEVLRVTEKD